MSHTCFFIMMLPYLIFFSEKPVGPSISKLDLEHESWIYRVLRKLNLYESYLVYYNIVLSYSITEKPVGPSISELDLEQVSSDDDSFNKSDKDEGEIDSEEDFKEVMISLYTPTPQPLSISV